GHTIRAGLPAGPTSGRYPGTAHTWVLRASCSWHSSPFSTQQTCGCCCLKSDKAVPRRQHSCHLSAAKQNNIEPHQTRHWGLWTIGWPSLQPNACWNSELLARGRLTRNSAKEWGVLRTWDSAASGRTSSHQLKA